MKKAIKWIVAIVVLTGGGYWFYRAQTEKKVEVKPTYEHVRVEIRDIQTIVESTGEVQPRNRLDVKPPISGRLEELLVDEGDEVKKGQILGWLSSTERATLLDAALATSEEELEYWGNLYKPSPLISPLAGTVIARNFEPGQSIGVNDAVVVIADDLIVVANLDETDIGLVRLEQKVEVYLEAYPENRFECVVEKIAYDALTESNVTMYEVDVRPLQLPEFARSGMTANLEFVLEERNGVIAVDSSAIVEGGAQETGNAEGRGTPGEHMEAAEGATAKGSAERTPEKGAVSEVLVDSEQGEEPSRQVVKIGISDGQYTEILEGLEEGDIVLIEKIKTGQHEAGGSPFMPRRR
jgi:macrolide-specific efflux system membrane fusion protein